MTCCALRRRALGTSWQVDSYADYHARLLDECVEPYLALAKRRGHEPGSLLAIGASVREARRLVRHPFERIVLSGVTEPDEALSEALDRDPRLEHAYANAECLPYPTASFDVVLCKEALHHLARPVLGLYEMLRVARRGVVFVEPWQTPGVRVLERLGLATRFERNQRGNLLLRDNYLFRWSRSQLVALLTSLYLESGARLEVTLGWSSSRVLAHRLRAVRRLGALAGWGASFLPGARGNLASVLITPGAALPPDPRPHEAAPG